MYVNRYGIWDWCFSRHCNAFFNASTQCFMSASCPQCLTHAFQVLFPTNQHQITTHRQHNYKIDIYIATRHQSHCSSTVSSPPTVHDYVFYSSSVHYWPRPLSHTFLPFTRNAQSSFLYPFFFHPSFNLWFSRVSPISCPWFLFQFTALSSSQHQPNFSSFPPHVLCFFRPSSIIFSLSASLPSRPLFTLTLSLSMSRSPRARSPIPVWSTSPTCLL